MSLSTEYIRQCFPFLHSQSTVTYLDTAATALKPQCVIDAMAQFSGERYGSVHRGLYELSEQATLAFEKARSSVASFLGALPSEIIYTKNATEAINLVASSFLRLLPPHSAVMTTILEHHSNFLPWQQWASLYGHTFRVFRGCSSQSIDLHALETELSSTPIVLLAITGMSNVLGIPLPLHEIIAIAHRYGTKVLIDATQLLAHTIVNVKELDCDFLVFSGHKLYGPTGIGVLYAREEILAELPPFLFGGEMVTSVSEHSYSLADIPHRFEAGTPPIIEAIGLEAALEWLSSFSSSDRMAHEEALISSLQDQLSSLPYVHLLAHSPHQYVLSFTVDGVHPHDVAAYLSHHGIAIRAGYHCAEPLHQFLGVTGSVRASVGLYTTQADIDTLAVTLPDLHSFFTR